MWVNGVTDGSSTPAMPLSSTKEYLCSGVSEVEDCKVPLLIGLESDPVVVDSVQYG